MSAHNVVPADTFMPYAEEAQRRAIRVMMTNTYLGGAKRIRPWDEFTFNLSWFDAGQAASVAGIVTSRARYRLERMVAAGLLDVKRMPNRNRTSNRDVRYRLPRATCEAMAKEIIEELKAEGIPMESVTWPNLA